jgi:hypothetical protein
MPGSNASSDGFDRSPLHGEGGGGAEEEETARDDGPEQAGEGDKVDESTAVKAEPKESKESTGGVKEEPNLGPTPQPSSTTAGKIFIGGLTVDTNEQDLKACFEVPCACSARTHTQHRSTRRTRHRQTPTITHTRPHTPARTYNRRLESLPTWW